MREGKRGSVCEIGTERQGQSLFVCERQRRRGRVEEGGRERAIERERERERVGEGERAIG